MELRAPYFLWGGGLAPISFSSSFERTRKEGLLKILTCKSLTLSVIFCPEILNVCLKRYFPEIQMMMASKIIFQVARPMTPSFFTSCS